MVEHKSKYFPAIDGLRAVAVLAVILFHFKAALLPGGFAGVDIFFVISGYVVAGSLNREYHSTLLRFVVNFYSRRMVRILPALAVCLLVTALVATLIVPPSWLGTATNKTGMFAFFGFSNVALVWFSDGYFSPRVEFNAFTHTWSLGVEEQFYFLFPPVYFFWMRHQDKRTMLGRWSRSLLPLLSAASLAYCAYATTAQPQAAYYLLPSRFWELGGGAFLFMLHKRGRLAIRSTAVAAACQALGLALLCLSLLLSDPAHFPFPWAMLAVAGTMLVICGVVSERGVGAPFIRALDNRAMVYIGQMSYSLYLWHWPVLVMFRWTTGLDRSGPVWAALGLIGLLSYLSFQWVEKPIRRGKFIALRSDWFIVSRGLAAVLVCASLALVVLKAQPLISLSATRNHHDWYSQEWSPELNSLGNRQGSFVGRRLFVLGDSHAGAYGTLLRQLIEQHGVEVTLFTKGGCPIATLIAAPPAGSECAHFIDETSAAIERVARPGDVVFLASLRMNRLGDQWTTYDGHDTMAQQGGGVAVENRARALRDTDALISRFEQKSLYVVMDAPKPVFKAPPFRCSDSFNAGNAICAPGLSVARSFLLAYRQPVMDSLSTLRQRHARLQVWDTFPTLCPTETCMAYDRNGPLFFDGDHLSGHGNRVLYPAFEAVLAKLWMTQSNPAESLSSH